jgi:hypothetical protein
MIECNSARTSASSSVPEGENRSMSSVSVDSAILESLSGWLLMLLIDSRSKNFGRRVARRELFGVSRRQASHRPTSWSASIFNFVSLSTSKTSKTSRHRVDGATRDRSLTTCSRSRLNVVSRRSSCISSPCPYSPAEWSSL